MSRDTQTIGSYHPYECVMAHRRGGDRTWRVIISSLLSHVWMRYDTKMNGSCHTYEWVMSHVWMGHVTRMNESWQIGAVWQDSLSLCHDSIALCHDSILLCHGYLTLCHDSLALCHDCIALCHDSIAIAVITLSLCAMTLSVLAHVRINYATHMHESCPNQRKVCECVCVCACACVCVPCGDACV